MSNENDYVEKPAYGKHVTELMRRINHLEATTPQNEITMMYYHQIYTGNIINRGSFDSVGNFYCSEYNFIYKYDNSGTLTKTINIPSKYGTSVYWVVPSGDGGIYLTASVSIDTYYGGMVLAKIDEDGNILHESEPVLLYQSETKKYSDRYGRYLYDRIYEDYSAIRVDDNSVHVISPSISYLTKGITDVTFSKECLRGGETDASSFTSTYLFDWRGWKALPNKYKYTSLFNGVTPYSYLTTYGTYHYYFTIYEDCYYGISIPLISAYNPFGFKVNPNKPRTQTTFYAYKNDKKESLGSPEGGASVPSDNALCDAFNGEGSLLSSRIITNMRNAIRNYVDLCGYLDDNDIPIPFSSLYQTAMGDRTKYGATGGSRNTWTRTEEQLINTPLYDIDIGEIEECVTVLENAS